MFGNAQSGANAYAKVGVQTGVTAASPHKLIVMLYEGALVSLMSAKGHMEAGNVAEKGQSISKAIKIIDNGLRASLDKKAGGQIAENLDALYEYMTNRLVEANMHNKVEIIEEVHRLLSELKSTWEQIDDAPGVQQADMPSPRPAAYDQLSPKSSSLVRA